MEPTNGQAPAAAGSDPVAGADGTSPAPESVRSPARSALIYCGLCGALNPAISHYCAACGTTLVDAFHATEGLRVYERPDSAARLVEIVPSGTELDVVEDPTAPADFVRVRLPHGRLGYIRLQEVEAQTDLDPDPERLARTPDINTNARGCVSKTAALASLALLVVTGTLGLVLLLRDRQGSDGTGLLALIFCLGVVPFLLLTIGFYLYARTRDERLAEDDAEP